MSTARPRNATASLPRHGADYLSITGNDTAAMGNLTGGIGDFSGGTHNAVANNV